MARTKFHDIIDFNFTVRERIRLYDDAVAAEDVMLRRKAQADADETGWGCAGARESKPAPQSGFEPPLVRFYCQGCKSHWDAWVEADGTLEDPRDRHCHCGGTVVLADDQD